jgi:hypothetical protein
MSRQAAKAAWKKRKDGSVRDPRALISPSDWVRFLHTAFHDMFEISVVPEAVLERMRAYIRQWMPVSTELVALEVVEGSVRAQIRGGRFIQITVHPDGTHSIDALS